MRNVPIRRTAAPTVWASDVQIASTLRINQFGDADAEGALERDLVLPVLVLALEERVFFFPA